MGSIEKKKNFYNSCLCEAKIPGTKNDLFLSAMKQRIGMILHVWYSTKYLLFNLLFLLLITRKSHYLNLTIKQVFRHLQICIIVHSQKTDIDNPS